MTNKDESTALHSYWQQQIKAWETSGQSQTLFCQTHDLSYHRFGYWRRKFLEQHCDDDHKQPRGFVPVSYHQQPTSSELSLSLPGGLMLQGIAADNLAVVYQLIKRLS